MVKLFLQTAVIVLLAVAGMAVITFFCLDSAGLVGRLLAAAVAAGSFLGAEKIYKARLATGKN